MTPEALAEALRLRLPNTEIVLGDKPGRVVVKLAPKPYALTVFIALSKTGDVATIEPTEIAQRPRDGAWGYKPTAEAAHECISRIAYQRCEHDPRRIYVNPEIEPRIRRWAHLPDVLPMIRPKVDALLAADRAAIAKLREDLRLREEDIAALERALGVAP